MMKRKKRVKTKNRWGKKKIMSSFDIPEKEKRIVVGVINIQKEKRKKKKELKNSLRNKFISLTCSFVKIVGIIISCQKCHHVKK